MFCFVLFCFVTVGVSTVTDSNRAPNEREREDSHSCLSLMLNSIGPLIFATARLTSLLFLEAHLLPLCSIASRAPLPTARDASRASNIHALR